MSEPVLAEPLTLGQEKITRGTLCSGKALLLVPFLLGVVFAAFISDTAINMRGSYGQPISLASASPMTLNCPRAGFTSMSVNSMQHALNQYRIPSTPLVKAALTQIAAARRGDAAAKEEFSKLDPKTKATLIKKGKDVVVKAGEMYVEDMAGVTGPLGFWDPFNLAEGGDVAKYRRAELKHGRVCMLSSLGIIVSEIYHPIFDNWGEGEFVSAAASHFSPTALQNFWPAFWFMAFGHEFVTSTADYEGREELDYGFDPLGLKPDDPVAFRELQNKELNNGRLAMVGAAGIIAQELVTGEGIFTGIR